MKKGLNGLLNRVKEDQRVLAVILFGSIARGQAQEGSDTDICLVLRPGSYTPLQLSKIKLEYVQDFNQDVQIFQQLPLYIRKRVLEDGKILYSTDMDRLYEVAFDFIREYADYEHVYRDYLGELGRAG
jgi:predicted nucleotidyltransferase